VTPSFQMEPPGLRAEEVACHYQMLRFFRPTFHCVHHTCLWGCSLCGASCSVTSHSHGRRILCVPVRARGSCQDHERLCKKDVRGSSLQQHENSSKAKAMCRQPGAPITLPYKRIREGGLEGERMKSFPTYLSYSTVLRVILEFTAN
jgi:hypothetical protein